MSTEQKMDAALKAKWVEALRSGEFKQGQSRLHDPGDKAFCCLGVLCKVMGAEFGPATEDSDDDEFGASSYDFVPHIAGRVLSCGEDEELKDKLCREIGIPDQSVLIRMNDGSGDEPAKPFAVIADYIEENL